MEYIINGLTDINMHVTDSTSMGLEIMLDKGLQEKVTLDITGLPENVSASYTAQKGIPTFTSVVTLRSKGALTGSYPIKMTGTSTSGKVKSYDLTLNITETPAAAGYDCITGLVDIYQMTSDCDNKAYTVRVGISQDGKKLVVRDFIQQGIEIVADVNCRDKYLSIPAQNVDNYVIGTSYGYFNDPKNLLLNINYTVDGVRKACSFKLRRP